MQDSLTKFQFEVAELRKYLKVVEAEATVLGALLDETPLPAAIQKPSLDLIRQNATNKKRHVYVGAIIVMYGALERFIENAVSDYLKSCVKTSGAYKNLPKVIQKKHTNQTIEYMNLIKDSKVKEPEGIEIIVENLLGCIRGNDQYTLNSRAFTIRSANMNLDRIRATLRNTGVDVSNKKLAGSRYYSKYVKDTQGRTVSDIKGVELDTLFNHINELVSIRNDIAHGVSSLDDIEDVELVRGRTDNLDAFIHAIHDCLCENLLRHQIELGKVTRVSGEVVVYNNSIVCFELPEGELSKNDLIIMCSAQNSNVNGWGEIQSIQVDGVDQETVGGEAGKKVGVKVEFHANNGGQFYVLPAKTLT